MAAKISSGADGLINVTGDAPKIFEFAERVIELGANAIMVNHLVAGIGVLKALAEDPSIKVPILGHMDFAGAIYEDPESGMSSHLTLAKLPRLAGADILVYPAPYGKLAEPCSSQCTTSSPHCPCHRAE